MDGDEEVCFGFVGYLGSASEFDEGVGGACVDDSYLGVVALEHAYGFHCDVECDVFFARGAHGTDGAGVFSAVACIEDDGEASAVGCGGWGLVCCQGKGDEQCAYKYNNV